MINIFDKNPISISDIIKKEVFDLRNISFLILEHTSKMDAEEYVKDYYSRLGFNICRLRDIVKHNHNILPNELIKLRYDDITGMPDFFVYSEHENLSSPGVTYQKKVESYFFIEVKDSKDGIRGEQIKWYKDHPLLQILIIFVKRGST